MLRSLQALLDLIDTVRRCIEWFARGAIGSNAVAQVVMNAPLN
jgi:hypothetical protein